MPISNKTRKRFDKSDYLDKSDYNNSMRLIQVGNSIKNSKTKGVRGLRAQKTIVYSKRYVRNK